VEKGILTLSQLIEKMSKNPARILGLKTDLIQGNAADITLIDLEKTFTVDAGAFHSRSRNTPFNGWQLRGKAVLTMMSGRIVFEDL